VTMRGDGELSARITAMCNVSDGAKAGVMVRGSLEKEGPHAFMLLHGDGGLAFQGQDFNFPAPTVLLPHWLKIVKRGRSVQGFESYDGIKWNSRGTVTLPNSEPVTYIGLAAVSFSRTKLCSATFDQLQLRRQ